MLHVGFYPSKKLAKRGNRFLAELNFWPFVGILIVLLLILLVVVRPIHGS